MVALRSELGFGSVVLDDCDHDAACDLFLWTARVGFSARGAGKTSLGSSAALQSGPAQRDRPSRLEDMG